MNHYEAIKAKAMLAILKPDMDYHLRKIYRWYSKTFATPLNDCYDLPIEFILQEYFEEYFEGLEEEDREFAIEELLETEDQRKARVSHEDSDKAAENDLLEMSKKQNAAKLEDKVKKVQGVAKPGPKPITNKLPEQIERLGNTLKQVADKIKEDMQTDPPDIDMKFEDDDSFERLLNADSSGDEGIKKP